MHPPAPAARKLPLYLALAALTLLALAALQRRGLSLRPAALAPAPAGTWVSERDLTALPAAPGTAPAARATGAHLAVPPFTPSPPPPASAPSPSPPPPARQVGLLAGHWRYDTGATCPDGLREVDVTLDVATRVKNILATAGIEAELLPEHDPAAPAPPLAGYRGRALVAIHADVCDLPGYSGFKVARWTDSSTPADDDRLVACLEREYARQTLLPRHDDTISVNMTRYYAFREIAADTPAAIIELGFLGDDRELLTENRYAVARGVADGLTCFLEGGP